LITLFITSFIEIRVVDIIDIFLVASLLYTLYYLLRGTAAINIFLGIVSIFLIWKLVTALQMELLSEILGAFVSVGFIALIIIFQPEIRQFLLALGTPNFIQKHKKRLRLLGIRFLEESEKDYGVLKETAQSLSNKKTGALIIIRRQNKLFEFVQTGVKVDAVISKNLIENIFFKNSPLHDGAMILGDDRIVAAGCILPVSQKLDLPGRPGLRHRAGLGISEQSDALAIIISEENGSISIAKSGELIKMKDAEEMIQVIHQELGIEESPTQVN
jgi:diadenylate cyclase